MGIDYTYEIYRKILASQAATFSTPAIAAAWAHVQSMAEHAAILVALERGDCDSAAAELRNHVAVQGEKFHSLIASLRKNGHSA